MRKRRLLIVMLIAAVLMLFSLQTAMAAERTVQLRIPGCRSTDPEMTVSITARQMPGVIKADGNYISQTVTITFDDTKTSVEQIVKNFESQHLAVMGQPKMIK